MRFFCSAKVRAGVRAVPGTVARPFAPKPIWVLGRLQSSSFSGRSGEADGRKRATKGENKMKLKMRTTATLLIAISMMILVIPVMAKPQPIPVTITQKQFQWRAKYAPLGVWTYVSGLSTFTDTLTLTGKVLHGSITYSPPVMAVTGQSNVYIQNKIGDWVLREGTITYTYAPLYLSYTAVNYFRGYMDLSGPLNSPFVKGMLYQWIYVYQPHTPTLPGLPNAVWDPVMNAWLVGFSIYLQGSSITTLPFTTLPPPVPANIYNPLGL